MTATCAKAVRSLRACARLELIRALSATLAGRPRMSVYHRGIAMQCRADARSLVLTSR